MEVGSVQLCREVVKQERKRRGRYIDMPTKKKKKK